METTVFVANGDTLVLGGILQQDDSNARTRVPLLGTLPVLGRLFRGERKRADQQQLLVFITLTVLKLAR
jgi:type IV pilus assembly protein PilQ